jgi:hypothetical protein
MHCAPAIIDLRGAPWPSIFLSVESLLVDYPTTPANRTFTRLPCNLPRSRRYEAVQQQGGTSASLSLDTCANQTCGALDQCPQPRRNLLATIVIIAAPPNTSTLAGSGAFIGG